jgi:opacity protein-like surface antigen
MKSRGYKLIVHTLAIAALAVTAQAKVTPYVSLSGGYAALTDSDIKGMGVDFGELSYDGGYSIEGAVGFVYDEDFNESPNVRAELALSFQENEIDEFTDKQGLIGDPGTTYSGGDAETEIIAFMLNGYLDIPTGIALTPYAMAGLGFADVDAELIEDTVFAYQIGAGLAWNLNEHIILDLKYKFFMSEDPEESDLKIDISSHQVQAGLRYQF